MDSLPQVISSSYGDDEQTVPEAYAKKICNLFAQLGAKGVSFLVASGDDGVGKTGDCFSNDGENTSEFLPSFPPTCPFVTAVGATKDFNPEVAAFDPANNFASGGGFSNYFKRPSYQDDNKVVQNYISSLGGEFAGLFNTTGRGYPDIAAQGQRFVTIWNGTVTLLDGTSASTPTASGVLELVNDALIAAGKSPLGFLNPWLYSTGYTAFTDITSGSAIGCGTSGFPAFAGWDAVTGFGTPVCIAMSLSKTVSDEYPGPLHSTHIPKVFVVTPYTTYWDRDTLNVNTTNLRYEAPAHRSLLNKLPEFASILPGSRGIGLILGYRRTNRDRFTTQVPGTAGRAILEVAPFQYRLTKYRSMTIMG